MRALLLLAILGDAPAPDPLRDLPPPYAAAYLQARPGYHDGRAWAPSQPWYFLPRPVLDKWPGRAISSSGTRER